MNAKPKKPQKPALVKSSSAESLSSAKKRASLLLDGALDVIGAAIDPSTNLLVGYVLAFPKFSATEYVVVDSKALDEVQLAPVLNQYGVPVIPKELREQNVRSRILKIAERKRCLLLRRAGLTRIEDNGREFFLWKLPSGVFGEPPPSIYKILPAPAENTLSVGSTQKWLQGIAEKAEGNPNLMVAILSPVSAVFAAICACHALSVHFFGPSSSGKTTLLNCAASIFRNPASIFSWDATLAGIQSIAAEVRHQPLILDESGIGNPSVLLPVLFAAGNRQVSLKAKADGTRRQGDAIESPLLSAGEHSIFDTIYSGKQVIHDGIAARIICLECNHPYGAFEKLHGVTHSSMMVDELQAAAFENYGSFLQTLIETISGNESDIRNKFERYKQRYVQRLLACIANPTPLERRIAEGMALWFFVGRYCISRQLLPWTKKGLRVGLQTTFKRYVDTLREQKTPFARKLIAELQHVVEQHEVYAAELGKHCPESGLGNGIFWKRNDEKTGELWYCFNQGWFEEHVLFRFGRSATLRTLKDFNVLVPGSEGRPTKQIRTGEDQNYGRRSFFVLRAALMSL